MFTTPIPKDSTVAVPEKAHLSVCSGMPVWSLPNLFELQSSGIARQSP